MGLLLFAQAGDSVAITGWSAFGLSGMILAWLFFKHLPAKDQQIKEILADASQEREKDRVSRHEIAERMRVSMHEQKASHDAERDKERVSRHEQAAAFTRALAEERTSNDAERERDFQRFESRLKEQAVEFKMALESMLKHCEKENGKLTDVFKVEIGRIVAGNAARVDQGRES